MTGRGLAILVAIVFVVGVAGLSRLDGLVDRLASVAKNRPGSPQAPYGVARTLADNQAAPAAGERQELDLDPPPPEIRFHPEEVRRFDAIKALYTKGAYQQALDLIYTQLADERSTKPYKAILIKKIPIITTAIAIRLANDGHCSRAIEIFQNAITRDLGQRDAHRGLLYCYAHLKQEAEGLRHVETYRLAGNDLADPIALLYEQAGRYTDAMYLLKKLIRHLLSQKDPDFALIQKLRERLAVLQSRLSERSLQVSERNANFRVTFREGVHEDISRWLLENAEQVLDELNRDYLLPYPKKPIETVLYPSGEFNRLVGIGPSWAKGVFDGKIRLPIVDGGNDQLLGIFRHELVHALLWQAFAGKPIPSWFNEGLAQLLECPGKCAVNVKSFAGRQQFLAAEEFLGEFVHLSAAKARAVYLQSLFMVATLAEESLGFGPSVYHTMLQRIAELDEGPADQESMSDAILKPVDLSFRQLHRLAARRWQQRRLPQPEE